MNDLADYVARGDCKSIEEYRHVTGQILGISLAERDLLDLQDKVKQRQDTDE